MTKVYEISGIPKENGVLVIADHAGNIIPDDIELGITEELLNDHIAYDIGTDAIAKTMASKVGTIAVTANFSRLVVDLNRHSNETAVIPLESDQIKIPGNIIDNIARQRRIAKYHIPYHDRVAELIKSLQPAIVVSLHSFTSKLRSDPDLVRPWDVGVLYDHYETASKQALNYLKDEGLNVGDQKPYSGKDLNATMDRHCETSGQPYFGIEISQDLIATETGQRKFSEILLRVCDKIRTGLA